ncbi:MAG TPA: FMN-binding protein [Dermatophilaceae bacterium]
MRRIVTAILSTISALVLLFSYHTSTDSTTVAGSPVAQLGAASGSTAQSKSSNKSGSSTPRQSSPAASSATYTGGVADTQWGPVEVQITVQGGKVTRSRAVQYPQNNDRDFMINSYALPILDQEVVQQQTASIDTVSGATVTSDGYLQSLQSAIDQAHL